MGCVKKLAGVLLAGLFAFKAYGASNSANYLNLDLRQNRYLGEVQQSTQGANYTQFSGNLNLEPENPQFFSYKLNATGQGTFEADNESYFGVPEAYFENHNRILKLTVGRKRQTWSRLDELFNFGIWQPQLRWDYLAPRQQGLTGLFMDWNVTSNFRLLFFVSNVNIPDQGPQFQLKDGRFSSSNRWFQEPHGSVQLFHETPFASQAPLYFDLKTPPADELFLKPSFAMGVGYNSGAFWTNMNLAYKPRNQIHLGIECTNCANVGGVTPLEITATIHPKIVNHFVATWETGFERVDDRGWVSLTAELPNKSGFPDAFEEAALDDVLIAGTAYQHYLGSWMGGLPSWLQYSYLRVFELSAKPRGGLLKEDQVQSSLDRYPLKEILALDWKLRLRPQSSSRLHWTNRYQYSVPEQGGWLSSQLDWEQGRVAWHFGVDVLGSQVSATSDKAGLFTRYRSNDRVFGGVSYVF